ncbi:MAG: 5'/3'-nucleotidase SurE [Xanthomonadales bacterium]|nr:5'/3'-nucleotidase SurE [Gammaproteobacteria bacterium]NNE05065.1 5'/3'-nucleotidase SurE [Xanthomonadales bacterium]NNL96122.1 5'/3'-nucleotidase SurE [Xanthomonadales bacterium]
MHFLISNDDGISAEGIQVLSQAVRKLGKVTIVAPDQNRSGASNSLTLESPVRLKEIEEGVYRLSGTPTDCVHIALTGLLDEDPDMVVSGINAGANLGDDVIYSGTVAAAMEGRFLGLPAIAVSLVTEDRTNNYSTAGEAVSRIILQLLKDPLPADTILNVNVPDLPWPEIRGFEVTRLGHRHRAEPTIRMKDPRGRDMYWIGPAGAEQDAGPGTDFDAVRRGYISVTPLHVDLTRYQALDQVAGWISAISTDAENQQEDRG